MNVKANVKQLLMEKCCEMSSGLHDTELLKQNKRRR
jgi:hypothetical protein